MKQPDINKPEYQGDELPDELLRSASEGFELPYDASYWEEAEKVLDIYLPQEKRRRRAGFWFWSVLIVGAMSALAVGVAVHRHTHQPTAQSTPNSSSVISTQALPHSDITNTPINGMDADTQANAASINKQTSTSTRATRQYSTKATNAIQPKQTGALHTGNSPAIGDNTATPAETDSPDKQSTQPESVTTTQKRQSPDLLGSITLDEWLARSPKTDSISRLISRSIPLPQNNQGTHFYSFDFATKLGAQAAKLHSSRERVDLRHPGFSPVMGIVADWNINPSLGLQAQVYVRQQSNMNASINVLDCNCDTVATPLNTLFTLKPLQVWTVETPIGISYRFNASRLVLNLGLSWRLAMRSQVQIFENGAALPPETTWRYIQGTRFVSPTAGIRYEYTLAERWSLYAEADARFYWLDKHYFSTANDMVSTSVGAGLSYRFGHVSPRIKKEKK